MKKSKWPVLFLMLLSLTVLLVGCGQKDEEEDKEWRRGEGTGYQYGTVKLGQYKGIEIEKADISVTDEEIEDEMDSLAEYMGDYVTITDRTDVRDGDQVIMDYMGTIDGVAFEGGTAEGADLVIGSGRFIDGFEEQLIGVQVGETVDIHVTFPDSYTNAEVAGQPAVFTVTIHAIQEYVIPEITDEFITEMTEGEYNSVQEYKEYLREAMEEYNESSAESAIYAEVMNIIIENSEFADISEEALAERKEYYYSYYEYIAMMYGATLEDLVTYTFFMTMEEFDEELDEMVLNSVKQSIVLQEIANIEMFDVSEEEYLQVVEEDAEYYDYTVEEYEEEYGRENIEQDILMDKAYQLIFDTVIQK